MTFLRITLKTGNLRPYYVIKAILLIILVSILTDERHIIIVDSDTGLRTTTPRREKQE